MNKKKGVEKERKDRKERKTGVKTFHTQLARHFADAYAYHCRLGVWGFPTPSVAIKLLFLTAGGAKTRVTSYEYVG